MQLVEMHLTDVSPLRCPVCSLRVVSKYEIEGILNRFNFCSELGSGVVKDSFKITLPDSFFPGSVLLIPGPLALSFSHELSF